MLHLIKSPPFLKYSPRCDWGETFVWLHATVTLERRVEITWSGMWNHKFLSRTEPLLQNIWILLISKFAFGGPLSLWSDNAWKECEYMANGFLFMMFFSCKIPASSLRVTKMRVVLCKNYCRICTQMSTVATHRSPKFQKEWSRPSSNRVSFLKCKNLGYDVWFEILKLTWHLCEKYTNLLIYQDEYWSIQRKTIWSRVLCLSFSVFRRKRHLILVRIC